jgi:branched-chain amino acid transport system substrate-binding protein
MNTRIARLWPVSVAAGASVLALAVGAGATSAKTYASSASTKAVTNYLAYVGGKAGPAKKSLAPVQIGWLNQQGGPVVIGGLATAGAQFAVNYINSQLGGVDGHPVKLNTCFIATSEQQGTTCGQHFVANNKVSVILEGAVATGIQPFYTTLAGKKPVIGGVAATPVDNTQKNATILFGDATHVDAPIGSYAKKVLHAKTASIVYPNGQSLNNGANAIKAALQAEGISVKVVTYDPTLTDVTQPLQEAGVTSADVVVPLSTAGGCVALAKGLQSLGVTDPKKIVTIPLCLSAPVMQALGDYPKWTYLIASSLFGDMSDASMKVYMGLAAKYKQMAVAPDPWYIIAFSQVLTTVRFMNQLGYGHITPSAIQAKAKAFKGPVLLGAPSLDCGRFTGQPAVCNNQAQFFEYDGANKFVKTSGWITPPAGK